MMLGVIHENPTDAERHDTAAGPSRLRQRHDPSIEVRTAGQTYRECHVD